MFRIHLLNKLIVSAYKEVGFVVLTVILLGLVGYLGVNVFFFLNQSWIAPTILSRADERVMALSAQAAQNATLRDKLGAERLVVLARIQEAETQIASEEAFQAGFLRALQADISARAKELDKLNGLRRKYDQSKDDIERNSQAYAEVSRQRSREMLDVHLVDDEHYAAARYNASQIARSNLSLEENQVSLDNHSREIRRDVESLRAIQKALESGDALPPGGDVSYQVLRVKEDYTRSVMELAKARDARDSARQDLAVVDASIGRYDRIMKGLQDSAYLKAVEQNLDVAFVPYDNVQRVRPHAAVYGCKVGLFWCRRVGEVVETLEGEVQVKHPLHAQIERGLMVRLDLHDAQAAKEKILFLDRAPLLF